MSTLYIRLPSQTIADSMQENGTPVYCEFALLSNRGLTEREGTVALPDLNELVRSSQRVVLLLAASDVTLLRVKVPPLSATRLKAALPNIVEDQLMGDLAESVIVAGQTHDGLRTVAVVQRSWLELLSKTLVTLGARSIVAVPTQLCLPHQSGAVTSAISEHGTDVEVALRMGAQEGMGLPIYAEQPESAPVEVMQALFAVVPHESIHLLVPQSRIGAYEDALRLAPSLAERITLSAQSWMRWIDEAEKTSLNLMEGLGASAGPSLNWRPWRWPLALAAVLLVVNALGLNIDWLRLKREADTLQVSMLQMYKSAYPKESVIIDPLAQMRQKAAEAKRMSGQIAPDDFIALASAFSEAWLGAGQDPKGIAGVEYHDRALSVKLKSGTNPPADQITAGLASRNLSLSQPNTGVWQIRSAK